MATASNGDSNAVFSYEWNTGSTSNEITVDAEGVYSVTAEDQDGCVGSLDVQIFNGDINCNLSTRDVLSQAISLYPNPNDGSFMLDLGDFVAEKVTIRSLNGAIVHLENTISMSGQVPMDLSHLPQGVYFLEVMVDGYSPHAMKLVVTK